MTANTTPDAESFENAVIELLGLEALTKDKISPFDIAKRFYYRGVADASPSVERMLRTALEEIAGGKLMKELAALPTPTTFSVEALVGRYDQLILQARAALKQIGCAR